MPRRVASKVKGSHCAPKKNEAGFVRLRLATDGRRVRCYLRPIHHVWCHRRYALPFSLNLPPPPPPFPCWAILLSSSPPLPFSLSVALRFPLNDRDDIQFHNVHHDRDRSPIRPQAIPLHLASHILSTSCSTYYCPHLYRLPNRRCHHRRSGQGRRCQEHSSSKLSSRGACRHRWRVSTSFLGRACKCTNDQCSPRDHGRCTHRVDSQVRRTFLL